MYNVRYYDECGNEKHYLAADVASRKVAEKWCERFNSQYRKRYPNGRSYYSAAQVCIVEHRKCLTPIAHPGGGL